MKLIKNGVFLLGLAGTAGIVGSGLFCAAEDLQLREAPIEMQLRGALAPPTPSFSPSPTPTAKETSPSSVTADSSASPAPRRYPPLSEDAKLVAAAGMEAFQKGDLVEAQLQFEKMRALSPGHPMALVNLGTILFQQGKFRQSAKDLEQATQMDPDGAQAWSLLGMVYFYCNETDRSLAALTHALVLDPDNAKTHNYLGITIGHKGWFDGAESELRRAIQLDPNYADAHFNLALIYLQRDPPDLALARRHYKEALALGAPGDPDLEKKLK